MYKGNMDLFTVKQNFKVKFSLIIKGEEDGNFNKKIIQKYTIDGNEYVSISANPFIVVDISNKQDKEDGIISDCRFNLNRRNLFLFTKKLERFIKSFYIKDLFYYDADEMDPSTRKLKVNQEIAAKNKMVHQMINKTVMLQACVVHDKESNQDYEGCFLAINNYSHFVELSFMELSYLSWGLNKVDLDALTLQMLSVTNSLEKISHTTIPINKPKKLVKEEKIEEISDNKQIIKPKEEKAIPDDI